VPSSKKWYEMKSLELEKLLGIEHEMVMHAIFPFEFGGGLDLYYYEQKRGFAIATKELIDEYGDVPKNRQFKGYEITMFSPVKFDLDQATNKNTEMGKAHTHLN